MHDSSNNPDLCAKPSDNQTIESQQVEILELKSMLRDSAERYQQLLQRSKDIQSEIQRLQDIIDPDQEAYHGQIH